MVFRRYALVAVAGSALVVAALVLAGCSGASRTNASTSSLGSRGSATTSTAGTSGNTSSPPSPTTAAPPTTVVLPATDVPVVTIGQWTGREPATVYFSGDAGDIVTGISWSSWGQTEAIGTGTWHYLNCVPNCAEGSSTPYAATLTLIDPVGGRFIKLTERTSGPHGFVTTFTAPDLGQGACTNASENSCA